MTKRKILIVDDEKPTRDVMARALGATYECMTAPDAEQALAVMQREVFGEAVFRDEQRLADELARVGDVEDAAEGDELAGLALVTARDDKRARSAQVGRNHLDLHAYGQVSGKAVDGNRHDLPTSPVRLLHTGYRSKPFAHCA